MSLKRVFFVAWFPVTFIMLVINLSMLVSMSKMNKERLSASAPQQTSFQLTAASGTSRVLNATIIAGDARVLLLQQFLAKYQSPLTPFADIMVSESDKNGLDYRLPAAIAMCESNLGKHVPSHDSYNPFGIAVYTGTLSGKKFGSWVEAIQWVTKYIKENYHDRGFYDLHDIGAIWAPPSVENGYSWTNCVQGFMNSVI